MKKTQLILFAILLALLAVSNTSAAAANKDMIQLQTQVQALQDQMARMQQSFDERMGVMKNLVEQTTDNINRLNQSLDALNKNLQTQSTDQGAKADQVSAQVQSLHDAVDELKARMAKVSKQLDDVQAAQQNLQAQPAAVQPGTVPQAAVQQPQVQAPPPDVLYNNGLRDYNAAKYALAVQEFADYLKFYSNTDLAGNAYFYLAEMDYRAGNYPQAVKGYDQVLQSFPDGTKAASAELKKGFALIESGDKDAGIAALRHVVQRYPRSNEALQARDRLRKLGVTSTGTRKNG